jgi:hypothetical protein
MPLYASGCTYSVQRYSTAYSRCGSGATPPQSVQCTCTSKCSAPRRRRTDPFSLRHASASRALSRRLLGAACAEHHVAHLSKCCMVDWQ